MKVSSRTRSSAVHAAWHAARTLSGVWLESTDIGTVQRLSNREILYKQGDTHDCFYLVRSGFVHTTVLRSNGSRLLLEIFGPGAIFGEASAFIDRPRYVTAEAVTPVVISCYHASDIQKFVEKNPKLVVSLLQLLGYKHRLLIDKLTSVTSSTPEQRMIDLLARVVLGTPMDDTPPMPLTHEQIAAMTGLSRITVTRTLGGLANRGLVATRSKGVKIIDPAQILSLFDAS